MTTQSSETKGTPCACGEMMQLVLDGAATPEQCRDFQSHLQSCGVCQGQFEVHAMIQSMVRQNCCGTPPQGLADQIRSLINHQA